MIDEALRGRLITGERVLWEGRPAQGLLFTSRDMLLVPFSLVWCDFAVFWTYGANSMAAGPFFLLWGSMFICIGLYFVIGRFAVDAWVRRRTSYALTDKRVLISRSQPFSKFTALGLAQLPDIDLAERRDGRGTIRFGQAVSLWGNRGMSGWSPALDPTPQFIAITDARRVFDLLQRSSHV